MWLFFGPFAAIYAGMFISDFDYQYPEELVAQRPSLCRDASRMMVADRLSKTATDASIKDLPKYLKAGDLLIVNDSKVLPVRLLGKKESGSAIEILLLREMPLQKIVGEGFCALPRLAAGTGGHRGPPLHNSNNSAWLAMATRKKRLKVGDKIKFGKGFLGTIKENRADGVVIELESEGDILATIKEVGLPPLPPYIKRKTKKEYTSEDRERYQTIYAKNIGSAAAPTAGFHLTEDIFKECWKRGVEIAYVTLHVGLDTFAPVRAKKVEDHKMHGEKYIIPKGTLEAIEKTKKKGGRVIAVGTTTVRALESAAADLLDYSKFSNVDTPPNETSLFITPGYKFKIVDALLTNFHRPKSTLIMMVSAFAGKDFILQIYKEAITRRYRLFSYGDCMLIC